MLVVKSAHVQPWHLDLDHPVLIELQLSTQYGDHAGLVAAVLSPTLAAELGVKLAAPGPDEETESPTGPDPTDVEQLTRLLDAMRDFTSNEQRARYLLTCNWLRERGATAAARSTRLLNTLRREPAGS